MSDEHTALIIDDDADYRQLLADILELKGWKVLQAEEGEQGLALARRCYPQVIICDLLMPRCNGFNLCRSVRQDKDLSGIPIVITSGRDYDSDRKAALDAGAREYLTKPLDFNNLLQVMDQVSAKQAPATNRMIGFDSDSAPSFKFWGVRGSIPTPGAGTVYYGGNTSCVEVRADGELIVLDAGSGLRGLGQALVSEFGKEPIQLTLLLTHIHWDHIQGIPFFLPAYQPQNRIRILGYEGARHGLERVLSQQMESPFFPVALKELPAHVKIEELREMTFDVGSVRVEAAFANHPGICVGYKLITSAGALAFFPDNEPHIGHRRSTNFKGTPKSEVLEFARSQDRKLIEFLRETEVLIIDAQYDAEEYQAHVGWGHGCLPDVVALAMEARVKRLYLFHHDPDHNDVKIAAMLKEARAYAAAAGSPLEIEAAREGEVVSLQRKQPAAETG